MISKSNTIAALASDLAKAQLELRNPVRDAVNPFFKSRYADLAAVRDAVTPVLGKFGLSVAQFPTETETGPALVSILMHKSGEWIETTILLRPTKLDPQGLGSATTYARRYALQAIAGVAADDDDDGNHASREIERPKAASNKNGAITKPKHNPDTDGMGEDPMSDDTHGRLKSTMKMLDLDWTDETIARAGKVIGRQISPTETSVEHLSEQEGGKLLRALLKLVQQKAAASV